MIKRCNDMKQYKEIELTIVRFADDDIVRTSIQDSNDKVTDVGSDIFHQ